MGWDGKLEYHYDFESRVATGLGEVATSAGDESFQKQMTGAALRGKLIVQSFEDATQSVVAFKVTTSQVMSWFCDQ